MPRRAATDGRSWRDAVPGLLAFAAFLSSGAWLVFQLPPAPVSKALNLVTLGVWLIAFGVGAARFRRPDRRLLLSSGAVLAVAVAAYLVGGSLPQAVVYDLFADMPALQWLAFPTVFLLAAGLSRAGALERGLAAVVYAGAGLSAVMAYQVVTTNGSGVFGSTAYSVTALVPLVPIGVGMAMRRRGVERVALAAAAAVVLAVLVFWSGSLMGAVAGVFAGLLTAALSAGRGQSSNAWRALRTAALALAAAMVAGVLLVQIPAVSGFLVNPTSVAPLGKNVVSRVYLWEGAQAMVAQRPLLGFGPSGYRLHAATFLDPRALQYGPDTAGNVDPTVYSPQSPHSVLWEIATRMGVLGVLAFAALFVCWALVLAESLRREDEGAGLRVALAAGFITALFALTVNPVVFPIGLFGAAIAGLAVAPLDGDDEGGGPARWLRVSLWCSGALVIVVALWLFAGEWSAFQGRYADPNEAVTGYRATLRIVPGHPLTERRLLEAQLLAARNGIQVTAARKAVDTAPSYMREFAPNLVSFAAYSLAQAEIVGRTDVSWETGLIERAQKVLPPIPSLVAERLHLALVRGDTVAVQAALPDAAKWGGPYPYTPAYIERAKRLIGDAP